ncbi:TlpA family protein disulfide reductase [Echinicola salinicaeni]|uniref:TlpA family protein disulfide reductase n=1 Tax=Echinicola salinicaeni TaxID=2762757 RepID=UPI00164926AC|nr:TlpA disulfide reductase family protein [Echinicola salinicaeni]
MKKTTFTCFLALLCLLGSKVYGKELNKVAYTSARGDGGGAPVSLLDTLTIGDRLPEDKSFERAINHSGSSLAFGDFKGKYLVLSFWSTVCSASTHYLADLEKLQEDFGDKIQFLPVTMDDPDKVGAVLQAYPALKDVNLPMVVGERGLLRSFPHNTLPHFVILDPKRKVLAITGKEDLTENKLKALIRTGNPTFRLKSDKRIPFEHEERLISENAQIPDKNISFQSALTRYIPGVRGAQLDSDEKGGHIQLVNVPLYKLYRMAYSGKDLANYFGNNRIIAEGFGEEELFTDRTGIDYLEWMEAGGHVYGYELITPPGMDKYSLMKEDLKRYFPHIEAKVEKRPQTVWAIVKKEGAVFSASTADKVWYDVRPTGIRVDKSTLTGFIYYLNLYFMQNSSYPVMDLTGIDYPIDFEVKAALSNRESLKKGLNEIGLDLVKREEEIPVLVLKKIGNPKSHMP